MVEDDYMNDTVAGIPLWRWAQEGAELERQRQQAFTDLRQLTDQLIATLDRRAPILEICGVIDDLRQRCLEEAKRQDG